MGRRSFSGLVALLFVGVASLLASACTPSLSPLYRDYAVADTAATDTTGTDAAVATDARIAKALQAAGWSMRPTDAPQAIATEERTIRHWGLYRVVAWLEVVPLGGDHVRVMIHPYRTYFTGSRSKIPYLTRSLQYSLLPDLNDAFTAQGLHVAGTSLERDRQDAAR